jgi:hypothetical protein
MKANSCTANDLVSVSSPGNVLPGDVVAHTVDHFNGNPTNGVANFLFTLPTGDNGKYEISGSVPVYTSSPGLGIAGQMARRKRRAS